MAAVLRSSSTAGAAAGGTATVTKPAGVIDGDILVAVVGIDAGTANTVTNPGGWTQVREDNDGGSFTVGLRVLRKVASGEPASWGWGAGSGGDIAVWVGAYMGGDTATPTDGSNGGPAGATVVITAPSTTPTLSDDLLVCAFASDGGGSAAQSITSMDGALTVRTVANGYASPGALIKIAVGDKQLSSAAAVGSMMASKPTTAGASMGSQTLLRAIQLPDPVPQSAAPVPVPHPPFRIA